MPDQITSVHLTTVGTKPTNKRHQMFSFWKPKEMDLKDLQTLLTIIQGLSMKAQITRKQRKRIKIACCKVVFVSRLNEYFDCFRQFFINFLCPHTCRWDAFQSPQDLRLGVYFFDATEEFSRSRTNVFIGIDKIGQNRI